MLFHIREKIVFASFQRNTTKMSKEAKQEAPEIPNELAQLLSRLDGHLNGIVATHDQLHSYAFAICDLNSLPQSESTQPLLGEAYKKFFKILLPSVWQINPALRDAYEKLCASGDVLLQMADDKRVDEIELQLSKKDLKDVEMEYFQNGKFSMPEHKQDVDVSSLDQAIMTAVLLNNRRIQSNFAKMVKEHSAEKQSK